MYLKFCPTPNDLFDNLIIKVIEFISKQNIFKVNTGGEVSYKV